MAGSSPALAGTEFLLPRTIDHRIYIFAPGRGVVRQWQIP